MKFIILLILASGFSGCATESSIGERPEQITKKTETEEDDYFQQILVKEHIRQDLIDQGIIESEGVSK